MSMNLARLLLARGIRLQRLGKQRGNIDLILHGFEMKRRARYMMRGWKYE